MKNINRLIQLEAKRLPGQTKIMGLVYYCEGMILIGEIFYPNVESISMEIRSLPEYAGTNIAPGRTTQGEQTPESQAHWRAESENLIQSIKRYA